MSSKSSMKPRPRVASVRRVREPKQDVGVTENGGSCQQKKTGVQSRSRRRRATSWVPSEARIDDAPVELQRRVATRLPWVTAVVDRPWKQSVEEALQEHAEITGTPSEKVPARTTVLTWVKHYTEHGQVGLLDRVRKDADVLHTLSRMPRTLGMDRQALDEIIEAVVVGAKGSTSDVFAHLQSLLGRARGRKRTRLTYQTVWRWVDEWRRAHGHLVHMAHEGRGAFADDLTLHLGGGVVPAGAYHSIDTSPADEWVRMPHPEKGWIAVRPNVTRIIDVGSRAALTFEVCVGAVNANTVLGILRRTYVPGENWRGLHTVSKPKRMWLDKGGEHHGALKAGLDKAGLPTDGPVTPVEQRAHIERLHKTLNGDVSKGQLGRTWTATPTSAVDAPELSRRDDLRTKRSRVREERKIERNIMLLRTLEEYVEATRRVCIAYNVRPHRGILRDIRAAQDAARIAS